MTPSDDHSNPWLLDEDAWDNPGRLFGSELFVHAGDGQRRCPAALDDPEDDR